MNLSRPISVALGVSLCGISFYILYQLFKKKEEEEDDHDHTCQGKFVVELKIQKDLVRDLIGRNGKNITAIQESSGAKINFKDKGNDKFCVIRGLKESCKVAENLVQEFIKNQPIIYSEDMWIPKDAYGKIMGHCGDNLTELQTLSGAKIWFLDDSTRNLSQERLMIKGTKEQITVARSLITDAIESFKETKLKIEASLAKREPRLPPKSSPSSEHPTTPDSPQVERVAPAIAGSSEAPFEVYVSAMVDPSQFWIQIVGPKATELDLLVEQMSDYYSRPDSQEIHVLPEVTKGDLVAAIFQYDGKWYRAEVLDVFNDKDNPEESVAELYYVDYGDTDRVPTREIYELRTDFLRLHFQAIECSLANVEPAGDAWSSEAIDKFEEWTYVAQWKKLSGKINGYGNKEKTRFKREGSPIPGIDLYDVNNEQDVDIAQLLVNHGFAVYKKNHNLRPSSRATSISNSSIASIS